MIKAEDVHYHTPSDVPFDWAETRFFSVYVPEHNLVMWAYTVARAGVGVMVSDIQGFNKISGLSLDSAYVDFQQHLPLPKSFDRYELPNGLSFLAENSPRDYQIRYKGVDDTEFDWNVQGLMEPYDIHDPEMDPLANPDPSSTGFGAAYSNHFDMTAHVTGTLKLRGKQFSIDCVTTMDHSWGPRSERLMNYNAWVNANFDLENAFHFIWKWDPDKSDWKQFELAHGYALVDGVVKGLVKGKMRAVRRGPYPLSYETEVTDIDGNAHKLLGTVIAQQNWPCYSNAFVPFSSIRWHYLGREGQGVAQECWPLDRLAGKGYGA